MFKKLLELLAPKANTSESSIKTEARGSKPENLSDISAIRPYMEDNPNLTIALDTNEQAFISLSNQVTVAEIINLLKELWRHKFEITFHDTVHPTLSDPGAYFSYSTKKTTEEGYWSMTYGNHGWSGGIYHIKTETIASQIHNLIHRNLLDKIQITDAAFFSHYEIRSKEESEEKDKEIRLMHE